MHESFATSDVFDFIVFVNGWSELTGNFELLTPRNFLVTKEEVKESVAFKVLSFLVCVGRGFNVDKAAVFAGEGHLLWLWIAQLNEQGERVVFLFVLFAFRHFQFKAVLHHVGSEVNLPVHNGDVVDAWSGCPLS